MSKPPARSGMRFSHVKSHSPQPLDHRTSLIVALIGFHMVTATPSQPVPQAHAMHAQNADRNKTSRARPSRFKVRNLNPSSCITFCRSRLSHPQAPRRAPAAPKPQSIRQAQTLPETTLKPRNQTLHQPQPHLLARHGSALNPSFPTPHTTCTRSSPHTYNRRARTSHQSYALRQTL